MKERKTTDPAGDSWSIPDLDWNIPTDNWELPEINWTLPEWKTDDLKWETIGSSKKKERRNGKN